MSEVSAKEEREHHVVAQENRGVSVAVGECDLLARVSTKDGHRAQEQCDHDGCAEQLSRQETSHVIGRRTSRINT